MSSHGSLKRPPPLDPIPGSPTKKPRNMDMTPPGAPTAQDQKRKMVEEARARAAALAASLGTRSSVSLGNVPASDAASRIAALKARVAAAVNSTSSVATPKIHPAPRDEMDVVQETVRGRGGLDIGIHPALLADSVETSASASRGRQAMKPKFATTMANQKPDGASKTTPLHQKGSRMGDGSKSNLDAAPVKNPYFDPNIGASGGSQQKARVSKGLVFNQKGKYIEQANALRKQAQLEELKARIAAAARRAGIEEDIDTDKMFLRDAPPEVEWWDQGLCANGSYDDTTSNNLKINSEDSIITIYVQHPILLDPPMEKHVPAPKPLPLTKKEQKKTRLQSRMMKLKESQAKVRLGLEPPEPPKVTMKNMMRVWGDEAVKDPTAVEAKVNKQIAQRLEKHLNANEERKLTKEQRLDKLHNNQEKDLAKGFHCLVFRIENLSNPSHQFKIRKNAEQLSLTGICINNPKFNLVVVEGGGWSINKYKKLMLQRIKWNETSGGADSDAEEESPTAAPPANTMEANSCQLVWEGELKLRLFKRFTTSKCELESEARRLLERNKVENYWTLAKAKVPLQD
ncbi:hypothetical protein H072_4457 [Dactylellina haptotyla CBS 200.50]|uniref:Uncharacterized protein n=1 Tax=Dactylellina haptotyla (strain CBS 200.50) TaxID=1284197 RepID=S8AFF2_DACHA|nr:hypothetical protein H072_4457 [Dactylellina haptotyla CBS 200.50]